MSEDPKTTIQESAVLRKAEERPERGTVKEVHRYYEDIANLSKRSNWEYTFVGTRTPEGVFEFSLVSEDLSKPDKEGKTFGSDAVIREKDLGNLIMRAQESYKNFLVDTSAKLGLGQKFKYRIVLPDKLRDNADLLGWHNEASKIGSKKLGKELVTPRYTKKCLRCSRRSQR